MNTRVWDKVGLELVQVDIQGAVETERSSNARNDYSIEQLAGQKKSSLFEESCTLCNQSVEVLSVGPLNIQAATADIIDGLVVNHERAVRVLKSCVGSQDRVVRLNNRCGHLGSRVN